MKLIRYLHPFNKDIFYLAKVKYSNGEEKKFDYIVGIYNLDNKRIKLIGLENKEIVILEKNEVEEIDFVLNKKEEK